MRLNKRDKLWYGFIAAALILPCIPGVIGGASFFGHVATMVLLYASMAQSWNIISGYGGRSPSATLYSSGSEPTALACGSHLRIAAVVRRSARNVGCGGSIAS
ncbi:MAG: hypothetical protein ACLUEQ_01315 [Cloacibacillus evryensis]